MRLMRISTAYDPFLRGFYRDRPALAQEDFARQYAALAQEVYGWSDVWTRTLGPLGYECFEPLANAQSAQRRWAGEHGVAFDESDWFFPTTLAQIERFRPDILVSNDYGSFGRAFIEEARRRAPSIRLVIVWCGAPYKSADVFHACDLVLTNLRAHAEAFADMGLRVERMHHAFDDAVLTKPGMDAPPREDFTFIGSLVKRPGFHNERERLLKALLERTDLTIFADLAPPLPPQNPARRAAKAALRVARDLPGGRALLSAVPALRPYRDAPLPKRSELDIAGEIRRAARPAVFGMEMYRTLAGSKLTLNTHIDIARDNASNMRLFEATGVGACLLTERQSDLAEIFEPDAEVACYASPREAAEKAAWLLSHDKEREAIARAGQRRTMKEHRWAHRAAWLDTLIRGMI